MAATTTTAPVSAAADAKLIPHKAGKGKGKKGQKSKAELSKPVSAPKAEKGKKAKTPKINTDPQNLKAGKVPVVLAASAARPGKFASVKIFGHSLTAVLRAAGRAGYKPGDIFKRFQSLPALAGVKESQIRDKAGSRCKIGEAAPLSRKELEELMAGKPGATPPKGEKAK